MPVRKLDFHFLWVYYHEATTQILLQPEYDTIVTSPTFFDEPGPHYTEVTVPAMQQSSPTYVQVHAPDRMLMDTQADQPISVRLDTTYGFNADSSST